jgi:hypothetical protein
MPVVVDQVPVQIQLQQRQLLAPMGEDRAVTHHLQL